jgi:hypothetical protein
MSPLQIAQDHCANWRWDASCLGAIIDDDLQIRRCCPKPKCVLGTPGERCLYFEECVAPMAASIENPKQKAEFQAAVRQYRLGAKLRSADERPCPICGSPIESRRRFCDICATKNHQANQRAWARKKRSAVSKVSAFSTVDNQGLTGAVLGGPLPSTPTPQK